MEENRRLDDPSPSAAGKIGSDGELARLDSDASALTAENCKDALRCSEKVMPVGCRTWTDEKHNLYLNRLEESFVKQLHQSKGLFAQCSEKNQMDTNISQKQLMNVCNATEQFTVLRNGCWQKIMYAIDEPLSRTSADSGNPLKNPRTYRFKRMGSHCSQPSSYMPEFLNLCNTEKHGEVVMSHGLATLSDKFSNNNPQQGDVCDSRREGVGQNFLDNDNQNGTNIESRAKRPRTSLEDSANLDQIVPSNKCPTTDPPVINISTHGQELSTS